MSRTFFYYGAIKKSIVKFLSLFDDIQIGKYNDNGVLIKNITVPIKFSPKHKFYSWLYQRQKEKRFPMIGVQLTSIDYDPTRESGRYEKLLVSTGENKNEYTSNPIPYNLGFTLSVATEHQIEQDQIAEMILPFFVPYAVTNVFIPEIDTNFEMTVNFNGASIDTDIDIAEDANREIRWNYEFVAKTWLVKPNLAGSSIGIVKKVVNKFYLSCESWNKRTSTEMPSGQGYEDEELLVLGSKNEDDEILASYLIFGDSE